MHQKAQQEVIKASQLQMGPQPTCAQFYVRSDDALPTVNDRDRRTSETQQDTHFALSSSQNLS